MNVGKDTAAVHVHCQKLKTIASKWRKLLRTSRLYTTFTNGSALRPMSAKKLRAVWSTEHENSDEENERG